MKTPQEIAQVIADRYDYAAVGDLTSPEQVHDMIVSGIEADRAQHEAVHTCFKKHWGADVPERDREALDRAQRVGK